MFSSGFRLFHVWNITKTINTNGANDDHDGDGDHGDDDHDGDDDDGRQPEPLQWQHQLPLLLTQHPLQPK